MSFFHFGELSNRWKEHILKRQAIDRDTYRQIKKMSREEMNSFLIRYAQNLCKHIDLRDMEKEIRAVSGMGEKRTELVMNIIEKYLGDS